MGYESPTIEKVGPTPEPQGSLGNLCGSCCNDTK